MSTLEPRRWNEAESKGDICLGIRSALVSNVGFRVDVAIRTTMTGVSPIPPRAGTTLYSGKLSYDHYLRAAWAGSMGLDLGAAHVNPDGAPIGETHKKLLEPGPQG